MNRFFILLLLGCSASVYAQVDRVPQSKTNLEHQNDSSLTVSADSITVIDSLSHALSLHDTLLVSQPLIHFDTATYHIKNVTQGDIIKQTYTFTNTGTDDLALIDVVPDCSCTSPKWTKGAVSPREKGFIIVTYDSKEDIGKFLKTITVLHNAGEGYSFLELRGFVAPKL